MERYVQIHRMRRVMVGWCQHEVTVRRISAGWNVRVFVNGELNQEARCHRREDIGYTARSLLRWEDKCGNISQYAMSARRRHNRKDFGA